MEKDILSFAVEKTHELIGAPTCSSETKAAAEAWLNAVGTEQEAEETKKYIDELEADIMPIDNLISFAGSEAGAALFGADTAANIAVHAKEIKAAGAKFRSGSFYASGFSSSAWAKRDSSRATYWVNCSRP